MQTKTLILLCLASLLLATACLSGRKIPAPPAQATFPDDWLGYWTGDMLIYTPKGVADTIPMALLHKALPNGRWSWEIIYHRGVSGKEERRAYELFAVNPGTGHYCVDEKDGILLDSYVRGNVLYSRFDVMGTLLESMERIENEHLVFEIWSGPQSVLRSSGDTIIGPDTIPPVHSYAVPYMQRAYLHKTPPPAP